MDCPAQALALLKNDPQATCIAVWPDGRTYRSERRGIAPLLLPLRDDPAFFKGAAVADRVIGRSAALLLIFSGAANVYGAVTSTHAAAALRQHALPFSIGEETAFIRNRAGDGMCPMEQTVLAIDDPAAAFAALDAAYTRLTAPPSA